jgi:hypothetical protein
MRQAEGEKIVKYRIMFGLTNLVFGNSSIFEVFVGKIREKELTTELRNER